MFSGNVLNAGLLEELSYLRFGPFRKLVGAKTQGHGNSPLPLCSGIGCRLRSELRSYGDCNTAGNLSKVGSLGQVEV
jgi:hypothetical protein